MKNILATTLTLLLIGMFLTINPALAGDGVKVFEMGESGQRVSFPMSAEEIAAVDTEKARPAGIRKAKSEEIKKQIVAYELAESGVSVEFPVDTPDEDVKL